MFVDQEVETDDSMREIELDDFKSNISSDAVVVDEEECDGHHNHGDKHSEDSHSKPAKNLFSKKKDKKH